MVGLGEGTGSLAAHTLTNYKRGSKQVARNWLAARSGGGRRTRGQGWRRVQQALADPVRKRGRRRKFGRKCGPRKKVVASGAKISGTKKKTWMVKRPVSAKLIRIMYTEHLVVRIFSHAHSLSGSLVK